MRGMEQTLFRPLHVGTYFAACSSCNLREICLPVGLNKAELEYVEQRLVAVRRKVARGALLYHAGDSFEALYAVWTGFFKTRLSSKDGRDQVTGFQMGGEFMGLDGIATRRHVVDAVALEDSQVCVIPFDELEALTQEVASLQQQFHKIMGFEIVHHQSVMLLLGSMYAEERLAAFLLNLTHRLQLRGYSASAVLLRMTREEIGSYLGLTLETVSRTFSKFQANGLLTVRNRQLRITDPEGLQAVLDGTRA